MNAVSQKDQQGNKRNARDNSDNEGVYCSLESRSFGITMSSNACGVIGGSITAGYLLETGV
jgi:hypothetical protein